MNFKYVRIQGRELAENTMYAKGIFSMCWKMIQDDVMEDEDADLFKEIDSWFAEVLPYPPQCMNRVRSSMRMSIRSLGRWMRTCRLRNSRNPGLEENKMQ